MAFGGLGKFPSWKGLGPIGVEGRGIFPFQWSPLDFGGYTLRWSLLCLKFLGDPDKSLVLLPQKKQGNFGLGIHTWCFPSFGIWAHIFFGAGHFLTTFGTRLGDNPWGFRGYTQVPLGGEVIWGTKQVGVWIQISPWRKGSHFGEPHAI